MKKKRSLWQGPLMYLLLLVAILGVVWMLGSGDAAPSVTLNYSEFLEWVEADLRAANGETLGDAQRDMSIDSIVIQSNTLYGLKENSLIPAANFPDSYDFKVIVPSETQFYADVNLIYESVLGHSVSPTEYAFHFATELPAQTSWLAELIPMFLTLLMVGLLWYFLMRQQTGGKGGMMGFGKSRARQTDPHANKVTFDDVAGADEEKEELKEIVQFLKNPKKFTRVGAKIPTGVLLIGPPGTGKTLLARAVGKHFKNILLIYLFKFFYRISEVVLGSEYAYKLFTQTVKIPVVVYLLIKQIHIDIILNKVSNHFEDILMYIVAVKHLRTLFIDYLTLGVHNVVVIKHVLSYIEVVALDFLLRICYYAC